MEHHPTLAPSSFPALQVCSHFVSKSEAGDSAKRGDRIHELTEAYLAGLPLVGDKEEIAVAMWMADKTQELLGKVEGVAFGISIRDPLSGEEITFGTIDVWGYNKGEIPTIIDWKSGYPANYDAQVMIYALGLMDQLKIDSMECIIVYGDQQKIERIAVTREMAEDLLYDTLWRKDNPDEPYVKSTYCGRCAIRPTCPLWVDVASDALAVSESRLDIRDLSIIVKDPEKLGKFLKGWKSLSKLVEDYNLHGAAIEFLEKGIPVGDYEVRERKGRREYAGDSVQTILRLIKDGDLDVDRAAAMFKLSADEVDKFFKEVRKPCPINTIVKGTYKILAEKNGNSK